MNYIDYKYCSIISPKLERFKIKDNSPYRANFRCPLCGDSHKSKIKSRGWFLEADNHAVFYCHNCGASMSLGHFLKHIDMSIYNDYIKDILLEKYKSHQPERSTEFTSSKPDFSNITEHNILNDLRTISSLDDNHPAKLYVQNRKIPEEKHSLLYYCPKFKQWTNSIIPDKFDTVNDEPRLIIPFIDKNGNVFGYQGRSFKKKTDLRYITIMINENMPKIFGLDRVNFNKSYTVVEGPLDSLFLDNSVAMAGSSINLDCLVNVNNATFVFDNERRNIEIVSKMETMLKSGFKVCIWGNDLTKKDINDMLLKENKTSTYIQKHIEYNTYEGLNGLLYLSKWRKC